jgi:hypothetical protein
MGYDTLHRGFGWSVPERFNMAEVCSRRWAADPVRRRAVAVVATAPDRPDQTHTYADLQAAANRLSNALVRLGVQRGDRVAIVMPSIDSPEFGCLEFSPSVEQRKSQSHPRLSSSPNRPSLTMLASQQFEMQLGLYRIFVVESHLPTLKLFVLLSL